MDRAAIVASSLRRSFAALAVAFVAAGCSSGTDSSDSAAAPETSTATESGLVELPSPPTTQHGAMSIEASTPTTAVAEPSQTVQLEAWDRGAPCRVPVEQAIGSTLKVVRTFYLVVSETDDGYRLDFENEAVDTGPIERDMSEFLFNRLAVLPTMLLDDRGRFRGFEDLESELRDLDARRPTPLGIEAEEAALVEPIVRSVTFDSWAGFWMSRDQLGLDTVETVEERELLVAACPAEITATAPPVVGGPRVAEFGESTARFSYTEIGADLTTVGGPPIALAVEASAFIELEQLRPFESQVHTVLFSTTDGRRVDTSFDIEIETEFDWENAEGCE